MKGARVRVVYLDPEPGGAKVGLDDYLAAGGDVGDLVARAEDDLRPLPGGDAAGSGPYAATEDGFVYRKPTQNGLVEQDLTNFTARIVEEVVADDGSGERAELAIEGQLGGEALPRLRVPMRRFASLDWVFEWGARPRIGAGMGVKDRAREAIQALSEGIERRRVFEHPGWREIPGEGPCYLHAGGAIGAAGAVPGVDVALRGAASRIVLPDPPVGGELRDTVRASLALLDVAPDAVTAALLGAVYRAVLCELLAADVMLFLVGPTGVFKSELAALAMQHFGAGFDRLNLPAHWSATANFLERAAFDFKDGVLVVDDFAPGGSQTDVARLHATADRVGRGVGNRGGRGRMHADGTLRPDFPPRGLVVGTGEDAPRGQSLRSRMVILEVAPGDVRRTLLTEAQDAARRGELAAGLAGFVRHLAPQLDGLSASLPARLAEYRNRAHHGSSHARTPDAVAHLALGWWAFLRFAAEAGAVTDAEADATFDRVWFALGETAARQAAFQASEEPARRFVELLGSALAGGFAHMASPRGCAPDQPEPWGWRRVTVGTGEYERDEWRAQGVRAGWIDGENLYLDLEAALAAVQRVGQAGGGGVSVTPKTLAKRLHERGFLVTTERAHGDLRVRRTLEGRRRGVLHLAASAVAVEEPRQSRHPRHDDSELPAARPTRSGNGEAAWPEGAETLKGIRRRPQPDPSEPSNGGVGGIGGVPDPPGPPATPFERMVEVFEEARTGEQIGTQGGKTDGA